jgi:hypothetical protein
MSDGAYALDLVTTIAFVANVVLIWPMMRDAAGRRWMVVPLLAVTAATAGSVYLAVEFGGWFDLLSHGALALFVALHWDMHIGARQGRPALVPLLLTARQLRRGKTRLTRADGRPMQTIGELRAEYGQGVLDDAARDPALDRVLNIYVDKLTALLRNPGDGDQPLPLDLMTVTSLANKYVDSLSEPGRQGGSRPYCGYSTDMLAIAAMCRLAERLPTLATDRWQPGPAVA